MEAGANCLRDELKRQLLLDSIDGPQVQAAGIVTVRDLGDDYLNALQGLDQQVAGLRWNSGDAGWADVPLHDHSLLWKVSSFCGPYPYFLDPEFMRTWIKNIHSIPSDPIRTYTDDIWHHPRLSSWANADTSSLLLVQGNYDSAARLTLFGADLAKHVDQQQPTAYVSFAPVQQNSCEVPFPLAAAQVLRHIAIQALRTVARPASVPLLIDTVGQFSQATTCKDWFGILERVLPMVPSLYIIAHLGTHPAAEEVQDWPQEFQALLEMVRTKSPSTIIRVVIITCRSFGVSMNSSTTPIISAGRQNLPPDYIRSLPMHRVVIPRSLLRLPEAACVEESSTVARRDDRDKLAISESQTRFNAGTWRTTTSAQSAADKGDSRPNDRRDFDS